MSLGIRLRDSSVFSEHGRRLLVSLGVVDPDPLLVTAEEWLADRPYGPMTCAAHRVEVAIGEPWPVDWLETAALVRATSWKGPLA